MKFASAVLGPVVVFVGFGAFTGQDPEPAPELALTLTPAAQADPADPNQEVLEEYCYRCHGDRLQRGDLRLNEFDITKAADNPVVAEKIARKLRAGLMPPAGQRRPEPEVLAALATRVESLVDETAAANPNPGHRTFQRLNRAEYRASVRELLDLDVDAGDFLPLDTKSANFDNIADAQVLSPTLLEAYLTAADEISRLAVGDPNAPVRAKTFTNSGYVSQWERVEGAPRGTRGGISEMVNFPADGGYVFELAFEHVTTGGFTGSSSRDPAVDISIDGQRVALVQVDQFMSVSDPNGARMWTDPIHIKAGPHRVSAAFLRWYDGPLEDPLSPFDWSLVTRGGGGSAMTVLAHIKDLVVKGPYEPTGVSETPSRNEIFTRRPTSAAEEREVAAEIITRLGTKAFRGSLSDEQREALLSFYEQGAAEGGFELGVRKAVQAILSSPHFVFRMESFPEGVEPGASYEISDVDLASRLSFFLWGSIPDEELLQLGIEGQLSDPEVLEAQVQRMLRDPRTPKALATRFAAQWLRLDDLDKVQPDRLAFPDFHVHLRKWMRQETELFFENMVREDRDIMELVTADYTFVNEALANHYGIRNVSGQHFRKVQIADENRRGLLGQGSVLTLTSHANRTSAVLRGKWVMEVMLGSPPPPPPPNVPMLEETEAASEGRLLSVAERLAIHRENPACNSCHLMIDPIGVALENFDVTGRWRIKDNLNPIISDTELYDGTEMDSPIDLRDALIRHSEAFRRTMIENLMAYALGRRIAYYDMPSVREIARQADANGNRISSLVLGVVKSPAFQMSRLEATVPPGDERK